MLASTPTTNLNKMKHECRNIRGKNSMNKKPAKRSNAAILFAYKLSVNTSHRVPSTTFGTYRVFYQIIIGHY